jgi:hypothetical protein
VGRIVSFVHSESHARSPGNVHGRAIQYGNAKKVAWEGGTYRLFIVKAYYVRSIKEKDFAPQSRDSWLRFRTTRTEEIVPLARKNWFRNR